jgi:Flp pilus assembly pilin Flp
MSRHWSKLAGDRQGTTSIEYGVIIALTGLALIAAMAALGDVLLLRYGDMEDLLVQAGRQ